MTKPHLPKEIVFFSADRQAGGIQRALRDWANVITENANYRLTLHAPDTPAMHALADELSLPHRKLTTFYRLICRFLPRLSGLYKKADIVFVHNGFLVPAAKQLAHKVIGVCHNDKPAKFWGADHLICLTPDGMNKAADAGWAPERLSCIPHFITETAPANPQPLDMSAKTSDLHIISAGRLVAKKHFALFIEAAALAKSSNPNLRFTLAGTGPEASRLTELNTAFGNPVSLIGWADLKALAKTADIFCSPSKDEPYGYVLTEMMQAGLAILASPSFGANLILDKGNVGPILPVSDAQAWADKLLSLDKDRDALEALKIASMKRLNDPLFSRDRFASDINNLIDHAVS